MTLAVPTIPTSRTVGGVVGGVAGHKAAEAVNPEGDEISGDKVPDPGTKHD
ncbi:MAG TPA: hypothetical protein VFV32_12035 [Acidimicrobiales bacterium]|nr:hypothetical protein [Acidimicrobiales bacterium]